MEGFWGVYYTGQTGMAAFGALLKDGRLHAVDPTGGDIAGTYSGNADGSLTMSIVFSFSAGTVLVTGQTIPQAVQVPAQVTFAAATLAGQTQTIDLPFGRVNARMVKKLAL